MVASTECTSVVLPDRFRSFAFQPDSLLFFLSMMNWQSLPLGKWFER